MLTEIIAAGAMGVSVFFAVKAYSLLKEEQAREAPRPVFLRSIYMFMGFALLMTPLALGIEYARHQMGLHSDVQGQADLLRQLAQLGDRELYVLDAGGQAASVGLALDGEDFVIGKDATAAGWGDLPLTLQPEQGRMLVVRQRNGKTLRYGYLDSTALLRPATSAPATSQDPILANEQLIATGLMYTPASRIKDRVQQEISRKKADGRIANRFLVDFVHAEDLDRQLQALAVKLLIQPTQMNALEAAQYDKLIATLSVNGPRNPPWRHYELAQVYLSRSVQLERPADREAYFAALCAYKHNYEAQRYMQRDTITYALEQDWYRDAITNLRLVKCDDNCRCVER